MCMRVVGVALLVGVVLSACGTAEDDALLGGPAPASPSPSGQQVALNHCGVVNVQYEGQEWEVENIPFDGTNAPDTFSGFGSFDLRGEDLLFTDDEGATLTFVRWDGTPNPYNCG